jgi:PucR C-terminal helix-turn-helix domain
VADHKFLAIGGYTLHTRLARHKSVLARRIVERIVEGISQYEELPDEELAGDITGVVEENLRLFRRVLRERQVPQAADLVGPLTVSAARRAEEGMPLGAVLAAYYLGIVEIWRFLTENARPEDVADLVTCTELALGTISRLASVVSTAYLEERRRMSGQERDARQRLMSALLNGEPPAAAAVGAAVRLPAAYLVMNLSFGAHPDESDPAVSTAIATSRKIGRILRRLDEFTDETVLTRFDGAGGIALIPAAPDRDWCRIRGLVEAMSASAGVPITAAADTGDTAGVAAIAQRNKEIMEIVRSFGYGPGLYRLGDVLLEYQLSRQTAATEGLAALLDPIDGRPELLTTLDRYLHNAGDRRKTATALGIHINTLDYRLRRIAELTGLNPAEPAALVRIHAAVAARAMP